MLVQLPVTTEVLEKNADLQPRGKVEANRIIIEFDTRKRDYHKLFKLKRYVQISWINELSFEVQELSACAWPIVYRITTATGYYAAEPGQRVYFTPEIAGLSTQRKVSDVLMRLPRLLMHYRRAGRAQSQLVAERVISSNDFQISA